MRTITVTSPTFFQSCEETSQGRSGAEGIGKNRTGMHWKNWEEELARSKE